MSIQRALVLKSTSEPLSLSTLPIPTPTPGSVIIRVLAQSIIPYFRAVFNGTRPYTLTTPLIPGSNCIGRIHAVGPDAISLQPGQLVFCDITVRARDDPDKAILMGLHGGMGEEKKLMDGVWRDGSFAEYARWPTENLFVIDEDILFGKFGYKIEDLCGISSSLVPYGGFAEINLQPGETVIVAPATGKFGGGAVTTALAMGASVIACGRNKSVLDSMSTVFSHTGRLSTVVLTGDATVDTTSILSASRSGKGADIYVDFSPPAAAKSTHIAAALAALKHNGRALLMGGIMGEVQIPYSTVMFRNLRIQGRFMWKREVVGRFIGMLESGLLRLGEEGAGIKTVGVFGLDQIEQALLVAEKEDGWGKQVVLKS